MGRIASASTTSVVATAYLTERGRGYLFGKDGNGNAIRFNPDGSDNFEISKFSLYDSDTNYNSSSLLETGDLPDIAGTSDNVCLKTSADVSRRNQIVFQGQIPPSAAANANVKYTVETANPLILQSNSF